MAVRDNLGGGLNIEDPTRITTWNAKSDMKKNTIVEAVSDGANFANSLTAQTLTGYLYTPVRNVNSYHPYMYRHRQDTTDKTKLYIEYRYLDGDCTFIVETSSLISDVFNSSSTACLEPKLCKVYGNYYVYAYRFSSLKYRVIVLQEDAIKHTFTAMSTLTELNRYNYDKGTGTLMSVAYRSFSDTTLTFILRSYSGTYSSYFQAHYYYVFTYNTSTQVLTCTTTDESESQYDTRSTHCDAFVDYDGTIYAVKWTSSNSSLHVLKGTGDVHHNSLMSIGSSGSPPALSVKSRFLNGFLYAYTTVSRAYCTAGGFSFSAGGASPVTYANYTDAAIQTLTAGTGNNFDVRMSGTSTVFTNCKMSQYKSIQPGYDYTVKTAQTNIINKNLVLIIANDPSYAKYRLVTFDNNSNTIYKSELNTGVCVSKVGHTTAGGSIGLLKTAVTSGNTAKVDFI